MGTRATGPLPVMLGVMAGLAGYTFQYAQGLSYFGNDPRACANCHVMREFLDSWQKSPHHGRAACNDCHTPHALLPKLWTKAQNGWNHSTKFTLQNFAEPIRITRVNARRVERSCIECHRDLVSEAFTSLPDDRSRDLHCVHCHAGVGHGPRR